MISDRLLLKQASEFTFVLTQRPTTLSEEGFNLSSAYAVLCNRIVEEVFYMDTVEEVLREYGNERLLLLPEVRAILDFLEANPRIRSFQSVISFYKFFLLKDNLDRVKAETESHWRDYLEKYTATKFIGMDCPGIIDNTEPSIMETDIFMDRYLTALAKLFAELFELTRQHLNIQELFLEL